MTEQEKKIHKWLLKMSTRLSDIEDSANDLQDVIQHVLCALEHGKKL